MPEEILAELGVNKLEYPKVIDLTTAQDILETIAKDINDKMQQLSAEVILELLGFSFVACPDEFFQS